MLSPGELHVWRVRLDMLDEDALIPAAPSEVARAARFHSAEVRTRYLRSHRALRSILAGITSAPLDFAMAENGKPFLAAAPEIHFNLSHSRDMALVGVALGVEVGVDIELLRPIPEHAAIAERFFPPSEAEALAAVPEAKRERDFFRRWTRIEAMLKARGTGLYGAGAELGGEWTVCEIDAGSGFAAAAAALVEGMRVMVHDFGGRGFGP
ncbi:MAG: 4'-phosphopantetheinyl transferase superfamily protein [Bryobacteraceae bacterium]|jgi:4'-phosphopantetheinyl transferase